MTLVLIIVVILLGVVALASLAVTADRSARATVWRQIAVERRRTTNNTESQAGDGSGPRVAHPDLVALSTPTVSLRR